MDKLMDYFYIDSCGLAYMDARIPFCTCAGENALMDSDLFKRSRLTLYGWVPVTSHMRGIFNSRSKYLKDRECKGEQYVDYLICRNSEALAGVILEREDDHYLGNRNILVEQYADYAPLIVYRESDMLAGKVEPLLNGLRTMLSNPDRHRRPCAIHALTGEEFQRYQAPEKGLLSFTSAGTYITEYGRTKLLFRGRFPGGSHRICAFSLTMRELERTEFKEKITCAPAHAWADKKKQIMEGLPCDGGKATMNALRDFGRIPLAVYLQNYPDDLKRFENHLRRDDATYQDAALYVAQLMRKEQPGTGAFSEEATTGKELMQILAKPFIDAR